MVFDSTRGRVVLFGGQVNGAENAETWEYDGVAWLQQSPSTAPPPRHRHMMAFDSVRSRTVLFGGRVGGSNRSDTWEWDGTAWVQASPVVNPGGRYEGMMAFDPVANRTVLYAFSSTSTVHTWTWDGVDWAGVPSAGSYSPGRAYMVFDPSRGRCQASLRNAGFRYIREFDGVDWIHVPDHNGALHHPDRPYSTGCYHLGRQRLIEFDTLGETWEWDNYRWFRLSPAVSPNPRNLAAMAFDSLRNVCVLFGGNAGGTDSDETWEYADNLAPPLVVPFGQSCATPGYSLMLSERETTAGSLPALGSVFEMVTSGGGAASFLVWGWSDTHIVAMNLPLPFDLTAFGLTNCDLLVDWATVQFQASSTAFWNLAVPNDPVWLGVPIYTQGVLSVPVNPAGLATTNGLRFVVGG